MVVSNSKLFWAIFFGAVALAAGRCWQVARMWGPKEIFGKEPNHDKPEKRLMIDDQQRKSGGQVAN